MNPVARVQGLILKPKEEWEKIKGEPATVADLFKSYLVPVAAIPAVAQFLGFWLIGVSCHPGHHLYRDAPPGRSATPGPAVI